MFYVYIYAYIFDRIDASPTTFLERNDHFVLFYNKNKNLNLYLFFLHF